MGPLAAELLNVPPRSGDAAVANAVTAADMIPPLSASTRPKGDLERPSEEERRVLLQTLGFDLASTEFANNLERLMEALYSFQFVLRRSSSEALKPAAKVVDSLIKKVTKFVTVRCSSGAFSEGDDTLVRLYQSFYRKLSYRDRTLPRPWVFTTNYDFVQRDSDGSLRHALLQWVFRYRRAAVQSHHLPLCAGRAVSHQSNLPLLTSANLRLKSRRYAGG
jgi:hypothetical protein